MRFIDIGVLRGIRVQTRTESTLCFMLPDNMHAVHIHDYKLSVFCSVVVDCNMMTKLDFKIDKRRAQNWEDLAQGFCEKAVQHFPGQVRHSTNTNPHKQWLESRRKYW